MTKEEQLSEYGIYTGCKVEHIGVQVQLNIQMKILKILQHVMQYGLKLMEENMPILIIQNTGILFGQINCV